MPRRKAPPRLYLVRRKDRPAQWFIRDGRKMRSTGCGENELEKAEEKLAAYLAEKYRPEGAYNPHQVSVADCLAVYAEEHAPTLVRADMIAYCGEHLLDFWQDRPLSDIRAATCRDYAQWRVGKGVSLQTARRDLEVLRAAIRYYHSEYGPLDSVPVITLPEKAPPRSRWLTRAEVAAMLRAANSNPRWRHVARFILIGVYTGTRSSAILRLTWTPATHNGWVDLQRGVIHRSGAAERRTKKRRPPVRIPSRLLRHLHRWHATDSAAGLAHVITHNGQPIVKMRRSWAEVRRAAGLGSDVVPHTLRHTCATWLMQAGVDIYEAAGFLGMSAQTLEQTYGHHHPDFQTSAAEALSANASRREGERVTVSVAKLLRFPGAG